MDELVLLITNVSVSGLWVSIRVDEGDERGVYGGGWFCAAEVYVCFAIFYSVSFSGISYKLFMLQPNAGPAIDLYNNTYIHMDSQKCCLQCNFLDTY